MSHVFLLNCVFSAFIIKSKSIDMLSKIISDHPEQAFTQIYKLIISCNEIIKELRCDIYTNKCKDQDEDTVMRLYIKFSCTIMIELYLESIAKPLRKEELIAKFEKFSQSLMDLGSQEFLDFFSQRLDEYYAFNEVFKT